MRRAVHLKSPELGLLCKHQDQEILEPDVWIYYAKLKSNRSVFPQRFTHRQSKSIHNQQMWRNRAFDKSIDSTVPTRARRWDALGCFGGNSGGLPSRSREDAEGFRSRLRQSEDRARAFSYISREPA